MGRYGYFSMELRLSIDIKIVILLSIMRLMDFFFTFYIHINIDSVLIRSTFGLKMDQFLINFQHGYGCWWCQNFVLAEYLENELVDFVQILFTHLYLLEFIDV